MLHTKCLSKLAGFQTVPLPDDEHAPFKITKGAAFPLVAARGFRGLRVSHTPELSKTEHCLTPGIDMVIA